MKNYFETCQTLDEAKKLFYKLAKENHPDKGGDTAVMQEILRQFKTFKPKKEKFKGEQEQWRPEEYTAIIDELVKIPVIQIEICGSWIWISGDTKPYKDMIKAVPTGTAFKCGFSGTKGMWYFSPKDYKKRSSKIIPHDKVQAIYGSERVAKRERTTIDEN